VIILTLAATLCTATDGDSLRCNGKSLRLLAINAPDFTRSPPCRQRRPGYICDNALADAAKRHLARTIRGKAITWRVVDYDRYRRAVVLAWADGRLIQCSMLASATVDYAARYDRGLHVAKACGVK
jgi:micrococcal nuclease